jgi:hypothetical protein
MSVFLFCSECLGTGLEGGYNREEDLCPVCEGEGHVIFDIPENDTEMINALKILESRGFDTVLTPIKEKEGK